MSRINFRKTVSQIAILFFFGFSVLLISRNGVGEDTLTYPLETNNTEIFEKITNGESLPQGTFEEEKLEMLSILQYGLLNNPDILRSRLSLDAVKADEFSAEGSFDASLNASVETSQNRSPFTEEDAESIGYDSSDSISDSAFIGVSKPFTTGTSVGVSAGVSRFENRRLNILDSNDAFLRLTVAQNLLRGFGEDIADNSLKQARLETQAEKSRLKYDVARSAEEIISNFWSYVGAYETLEILNTSVARLNVANEDFKGLAQKGLYDPESGSVIEARLDELESLRLSIEDTVRTSRASLALSVGIQADEADVLPPPRYDLYRAKAVDEHTYEKYLEHALENRGDFLGQKIGLRQADLSLKKAENDTLPRLELFGSVGKSRVDEGDGFSDTLSTLYSENSATSWSSGLNFSMPLRNRAARGNLARQKATKMAQELGLYDTKRFITFEIKENYDQLESLRKQIDQNEQTFFNFLKLYRQQLETLKNGDASLFDLVKSEQDLTNAESNFANLLVRYYQTLTRFRLLTSTLAMISEDGTEILFEERRFLSADFYGSDTPVAQDEEL